MWLREDSSGEASAVNAVLCGFSFASLPAMALRGVAGRGEGDPRKQEVGLGLCIREKVEAERGGGKRSFEQWKELCELAIGVLGKWDAWGL